MTKQISLSQNLITSMDTYQVYQSDIFCEEIQVQILPNAILFSDQM